MSVFQVVKDNITARQVAEQYGVKVRRNGMACCPFHNDKSVKIATGIGLPIVLLGRNTKSGLDLTAIPLLESKSTCGSIDHNASPTCKEYPSLQAPLPKTLYHNKGSFLLCLKYLSHTLYI